MGTEDQVVRCDLAQLAAHRRLSAAELAGVGRDVAWALAEAHDQGLVHRYLSAQHVVFEADGRAQVVGFGLPMALGAVAPEVAGEGLTSSASDVYALGALLEDMGATEDGDLAALVDACTARDIARRPSACELVERFERIAQDRVGGASRARGWHYGLAGVVCFVAGGLLALLTMRAEPELQRLEHLRLELPRPVTVLEMIPPPQGNRTALADR